MSPLGRCGFNSPVGAEDDARNHLYGLPFVVLARDSSKGTDYGWVSPVRYARKLIGDGIRFIWAHKE